jgi:hypothetical protein
VPEFLEPDEFLRRRSQCMEIGHTGSQGGPSDGGTVRRRAQRFGAGGNESLCALPRLNIEDKHRMLLPTWVAILKTTDSRPVSSGQWLDIANGPLDRRGMLGYPARESFSGTRLSTVGWEMAPQNWCTFRFPLGLVRS